MPMQKVAISVIIPALNEEKYIRKAFQGLRVQSFRNFETIVVDGNSSDRTAQIARKHARVIISRRRGVGLSRNIGARSAKGDVLVFMDADTKPSKDLLLNYHNIFRDRNVVAATGPILPLEKVRKTIHVGYRLVSGTMVKLSILLNRPTIVGSNFAVRRTVFNRSGGFDERMMTYEDWELSNRLKRFGRVAYSEDAKVHTSARRVIEWGITGYFVFYAANMIKYHATGKSIRSYGQIR